MLFANVAHYTNICVFCMHINPCKNIIYIYIQRHITYTHVYELYTNMRVKAKYYIASCETLLFRNIGKN